MKNIFLAVIHILLPLPATSALRAATHKEANGSVPQSDLSGQSATETKSYSSEIEDDDIKPRWMYRGYYRSMFPPMS